MIGRGAVPTLRCPRCQAEAMPGGGFVTCGRCGLVYDAAAGMRPTERPRREAPLPAPLLPARMRITDDGVALTLSWAWRRWPAPLLGGAAGAIGYGGVALGGIAALAATGALVVAVAGLGAAFALNRTTIRVDATRITVHDRPLAVGRSLAVEVDDLLQLYVDEHHVGRGGRFYGVNVVTRDGVQRPLALVESFELARHLEQRIEARLGLVDVTVAGEVEHD